MTQYLLACECGNQVPVDVGQAGSRVSCQCGRELDVPTLRKLRHLPAAAPPPATKGETASAWSVRKGVIAAFLLIAAVAALSALWMRLNEPEVPPFDEELHALAAEKWIDNWTPAESYEYWQYHYQPLAEKGFSVFQHRDAANIEQQIAQQRFTRRMLWTLASIFAAVALVAAFWPSPKPANARRGKATQAR